MTAYVTAYVTASTFAFSASLAGLPVRKMVREGVLGFLETLIISFNLGTPSVTFLALGGG